MLNAQLNCHTSNIEVITHQTLKLSHITHLLVTHHTFTCHTSIIEVVTHQTLKLSHIKHWSCHTSNIEVITHHTILIERITRRSISLLFEVFSRKDQANKLSCKRSTCLLDQSATIRTQKFCYWSIFTSGFQCFIRRFLFIVQVNIGIKWMFNVSRKLENNCNSFS